MIERMMLVEMDLSWIDLVTYPARRLDDAFITQDPSLVSDPADRVVCLIFVGAITSGVTFMAAAFATHALTNRIYLHCVRLLQRLSRAQDLDAIKKNAQLCVRIDTLLARASSWTGVYSAGSSTSSPPKLPVTERLSRRWHERVQVSILKGLHGVAIACQFVGGWASSPLGLYVLLSTLWVVYPGLVTQALDLITDLVREFASPEGLTIAGLIVAALALSLDHTLGARRRGLNAHLKGQHASNMGSLDSLNTQLPSLISRIESAASEYIQRYPDLLRRKIQSSMPGPTVWRGQELKIENPTKRPARFSTGGGFSRPSSMMESGCWPDSRSSEADDELLHAIHACLVTLRENPAPFPKWQAAREARRGRLGASFDRADWQKWRTIRPSIPRRGRAFVYELLLGGASAALRLRGSEMESLANLAARDMESRVEDAKTVLKSRDEERQRKGLLGPALPPDPPIAGKEFHRLVLHGNREYERCLEQCFSLVWDAMQLRAQAVEFQKAWQRWARPQGFFKSLTTRFGE